MKKLIAVLATVFALLTFAPAYSADLNKLNELKTWASVALDVGCAGGIVKEDREFFVLTAAHCVREDELMASGKTEVSELKLILVRIDRKHDVALYKILDKDFWTPFTYKMADSWDVQTGEDAWVIGNPDGGGFENSVVKGIVSFAHRYIKDMEMTFHQFDMPMRGGFSGGVMLNDELEIIGTVSWGKRIYVMSPFGALPGSDGNINFAVPIVYSHNLFRSL